MGMRASLASGTRARSAVDGSITGSGSSFNRARRATKSRPNFSTWAVLLVLAECGPERHGGVAVPGGLFGRPEAEVGHRRHRPDVPKHPDPLLTVESLGFLRVELGGKEPLPEQGQGRSGLIAQDFGPGVRRGDRGAGQGGQPVAQGVDPAVVVGVEVDRLLAHEDPTENPGDLVGGQTFSRMFLDGRAVEEGELLERR